MNQLTDLEINRVAFVEEGDNKGANLLLCKRKPEEEPETAPPENDKALLKGIKNFFLAIAKALNIDVVEKETNPDNGEGRATSQGNETHAENAEPEPTSDNTGGTTANSMKGVDEEVKIDTSKLTPEEKKAYENIVAKAAVEDEPTAEPVPVTEEPVAAEPTSTDDVAKGVSPEVAAEIKKWKDRANEAENRELLAQCKKYEILGKKSEDLAKTLKALKDAGGTAYADMISVLDASLETIEKSGAFSEIGKNGHGSALASDKAWSQIEQHAAEIRKNSPALSYAEAIDRACVEHPDLVKEYEESRN